jgi:hypothetical protein
VTVGVRWGRRETWTSIDSVPAGTAVNGARLRIGAYASGSGRSRVAGVVASSVLLIALMGAAGCYFGAPNSDWGPLAVDDRGPGGDKARTEGFLRIVDGCMVLEVRDGDLVLPLWQRVSTHWSAETQTVTYKNTDGSTTEFATPASARRSVYLMARLGRPDRCGG